MSTYLRWNEIRAKYVGLWIELVDVEWDWTNPSPTAGRVRFHSPDRSELLAQVKRADSHEDSVVLFVDNKPFFVASHRSSRGEVGRFTIQA